MRTLPSLLTALLAVASPLAAPSVAWAIPQNIFNQGGFFNGAAAMPLEAYLVEKDNWGPEPLPGPWQEDSDQPGRFMFDGPEPLFGLPTSTLTATYVSRSLQHVVASFPKDAHPQLARAIAHFLGVEPPRPAGEDPAIYRARGLVIELVTRADASWVKITRATE